MAASASAENKLLGQWLPLGLTALTVLSLAGTLWWANNTWTAQMGASPSKPAVAKDVASDAEALSDLAAKLTEQSPAGLIPVTAEDGTTPLKAYHRPANPPAGAAIVSVLIEDMGLSSPITETVLSEFPRNLTLAFNPYAPGIEETMEMARKVGFELLLSLPLEANERDTKNPGAKGLRLNYSFPKNRDLLHWNMARGQQYVGMVTMFGDAFTENAPRLQPILKELNRRGLMFVDATTGEGQRNTIISATDIDLPHATAIRLDDTTLSPDALGAAFATIGEAAQQSGSATVMVKPYPVVLQALRAWLETLPDEGIALVPVSEQLANSKKLLGD